MIYILLSIIKIYYYLIFANIIISLLRLNPNGFIVNLILRVTDPPLDFIRDNIPFAILGPLDLSPIILILILQMIIILLR